MPEDLQPATRLTPEPAPAAEPAGPLGGALLPAAELFAPAATVPEPVLDHRNQPVSGVVRWSGEAHGFTATAITDDDVQVFVRPVASATETGVELVDAAGTVLGAAKTHHNPAIDVSSCYVEPDAEAAGE